MSPIATEILIILIVLNPTNVTVYQIRVTNPGEIENIITLTDRRGMIGITTVDVVDLVQERGDPIREVDVGQDPEIVELGQATIVHTENHRGVEKGREIEN